MKNNDGASSQREMPIVAYPVNLQSATSSGLNSRNHETTRRTFLKEGAIGAIATAMAISWQGQLLSPREAKAQNIPLTILSDNEAKILEAAGEVLLPGSDSAGIANFVDTQLARPNPMLLLLYFDWPGSYTDFYSSGLSALDKASQTANGKSFVDSTTDEKSALLGQFLAGTVQGWDGPPTSLFYLSVRGDAVDVVYGTVDGFDLLNVPYMPHIVPEERW